MPNSYEEIYAATRQIPMGRVSSYGRVAVLAGYPNRARLVGYALHALRDASGIVEVPWWRVVNAAGRISNGSQPDLQRSMLENEGVTFDERGYIDLRTFLWEADLADD